MSVSNRQVTAAEFSRIQYEQLRNDILEAVRDSKAHLSESLTAVRTALLSNDASRTNFSIGNQMGTWQTTIVSSTPDQAHDASEAEKHAKTNQMVLDSLYFEQMDDRHESIAEAYAGTFQWIFDGQALHHPWANFVDWLQTESLGKLYWVTGKPGSGKPTLMRHVVEQMY